MASKIEVQKLEDGGVVLEQRVEYDDGTYEHFRMSLSAEEWHKLKEEAAAATSSESRDSNTESEPASGESTKTEE